MPVDLRKFYVYYTADIIRPSDEDTDVYGEPTEPGHGQRMLSGWLDPDWSMRTVFAGRSCVRPDRWEPEDGDPVEWLSRRLEERINGYGEYDGGSTVYSEDSTTVDYREGIDVTVAAHPEGFTPEQITDAIQLIRDRVAASVARFV